MDGAQDKVLAVVVTYHPDQSLARHLAALRPQVDRLLVVDNGSPEIEAIAHVVAGTGCELVRNSANLGIAAALNQAARVAMAEGYSWLATFDQDSKVPPGAMAHVLALYGRHPERERIAVMAMSHLDRVAGRDYHHGVDLLAETVEWRSVMAAITSGSLVRGEVLERLGLFDESLFIDCVDHDFCLRCRRAGLLIIEDKHVVIDHSIGAASLRRLLWRTITSTNHSPARRYYITRNTLEVARRNLLAAFAWSTYSLVFLGGASLTVLLLEEHAGAKLAAMAQGVWDFLRRRFGPRPS